MNDLPGHRHDTTEQTAGDSRRLHNVRNQLSIVIGYCDLLLNDIPDSDRRRADVVEIRKAADAAMAILEDTTKTL